MFGTRQKGDITFYYNASDLFNEVGMLSAYMVKNLGEESGSLLDELSISSDEKDVYDTCLKQAIPNIYEAMVQMTSDSGTTKSFNDADIVTVKETTGLLRDAGTYIVFSIKDNGSYNSNIKIIIDDTLMSCLKYGILSEFYSINMNTELYRISNDKFVSNLVALRNQLFQVKRKKVTSQFI